MHSMKKKTAFVTLLSLFFFCTLEIKKKKKEVNTTKEKTSNSYVL